MSNFNSLERALARLLASFPILKYFLKLFYERLAYLSNKKPYDKKTDLSLRDIGTESESFFGYYDKDPSNTEGLVLACVTQRSTKLLPDPNEPIRLVLYSADGSEELWSEQVSAYNWQQGVRAQWLDNNRFIFNSFDNGRQLYCSKVVAVDSLAVDKTFDLSVQDAYRTSYFLSLNYRRLAALSPDYGYRNMPALSNTELKELGSDGIWFTDFDSGLSELIISLEQICDVEREESFARALHSVNHIMIAPDGEKFIFIHRYFVGQRRYDRLMLGNVVTNKIGVLAAFGMVSHSFWIDNETIISYLRGPSGADSYWRINLNDGSFEALPWLTAFGDGHPHVVGRRLITDCYPDKSRMQSLLSVNLDSGEVDCIGEFFHGFSYKKESRCDLHPRLSRCGKRIYFDSVFSGKRKLYEAPFPK